MYTHERTYYATYNSDNSHFFTEEAITCLAIPASLIRLILSRVKTMQRSLVDALLRAFLPETKRCNGSLNVRVVFILLGQLKDLIDQHTSCLSSTQSVAMTTAPWCKQLVHVLCFGRVRSLSGPCKGPRFDTARVELKQVEMHRSLSCRFVALRSAPYKRAPARNANLYSRTVGTSPATVICCIARQSLVSQSLVNVTEKSIP